MGRSALLSVLVLAVSGCEPHYPGEPLGTFHVTGYLEESNCGQAVPAVALMDFQVELRTDDGAAFWRREDAPIVTGIHRDDEYRFASSVDLPVIASDAVSSTVGCTVTQSEFISVNVYTAERTDSESTDEDGEPEMILVLEGENKIDFTPVAGSQCAPALAGAGGVFATLPCRIQYTLEGTGD